MINKLDGLLYINSFINSKNITSRIPALRSVEKEFETVVDR